MHLDLNSNMQSNFNTDGRTDGRYEEGPPVATKSTGCNARAHDGESLSKEDTQRITRLLAARDSRLNGDGEGQTIAQIIDDWTELLDVDRGKRWPVIRSGQREPIAWLLRWSIIDRDGLTCKSCGIYLPEGPFELDHCIPWSAGGPDDSDNLRALCVRCNQDRSNFIDEAHLENLRPTTYWCVDCWTFENHRSRHHWRDLTDLNLAPFVGDGHQPTELVWCAHCHYYSTSDVYLLGAAGRKLIEDATRLVKAVTE